MNKFSFYSLAGMLGILLGCSAWAGQDGVSVKMATPDHDTSQATDEQPAPKKPRPVKYGDITLKKGYIGDNAEPNQLIQNKSANEATHTVQQKPSRQPQ